MAENNRKRKAPASKKQKGGKSVAHDNVTEAMEVELPGWTRGECYGEKTLWQRISKECETNRLWRIEHARLTTERSSIQTQHHLPTLDAEVILEPPLGSH
ncbi:hypothetical protein Hanom_Chr06g00496141 [Helianthus anomalus]